MQVRVLPVPPLSIKEVRTLKEVPRLIDEDEYLQIQLQIKLALAKLLGIHIKLKQRIPIFQLYSLCEKNIKQRHKRIKEIEELQNLLTRLTFLRINGFEPEHKEGLYI